MPLPAEGAPWPPPELDAARQRWDTWDAWWSADGDRLRDHYGGNTVNGRGWANRPAQHAGGVVGRVARMWWGRPAPGNEPDTKLHVPLAADLCRGAADLLHGEPIAVGSEDEATSAYLDEFLDDGAHARLLEATELIAALGGGYLRPQYDAAIADRPWTDVVPPECAQPEWRGGRLAAVNFWRIVERDGKGHRVLRHVERHEPGWIVHALYQGDDSDLGRMIPLDHPSVAAFAGQVNSAGAIETGWPRLDVQYVPWIKPNPQWRRNPALAPLGRSLLDGCEPLLDQLDETYSALMRDIRLAKARVFTGEAMLDYQGPGKGSTWDPDREIYAAVPGMMGKDERLTVMQPAIRVEAFRDTTRELINAVLRRAGLNGGSLGEPQDGGPALTAKEVMARNQRSMLTRERAIRYQRPELCGHFAALLATARRAFTAPVHPEAGVSVQFPDSVVEDVQSLATTAELLLRAEAASIRTRVEVVHPDWEESQVLAEVAAIQAERGPVVDAPFPGDGFDGDQDEEVEGEVPA